MVYAIFQNVDIYIALMGLLWVRRVVQYGP